MEPALKFIIYCPNTFNSACHVRSFAIYRMWVMKPLQMAEGFFTRSFLILSSWDFVDSVCPDCFYFFPPLLTASRQSLHSRRRRRHWPRFSHPAREFSDYTYNLFLFAGKKCFDLEKFHCILVKSGLFMLTRTSDIISIHNSISRLLGDFAVVLN